MMLPIYGRGMHCYQMDTLEQSYKAKNNKKTRATVPPYYLIIVNINSRKGYAYPMKKKNAENVAQCLTQFLSAHKMTNLYTDDDKAYTEDSVAQLLSRHGVHHTKTDKVNKHVLGIVNRFIKTLRDKNGLGRDITADDMVTLVNTYNDTVHSTTNCKPNDWTKEKNEEWIEEKHREYLGKIGGNHITGESLVRIPKEYDVFAKKRVQYEREAYPITGIDGNRYQVLKDGKVVSFSRFQLRHAEGVEPVNPRRLADNVVEEILGYDPVRNRYWCRWEDGDQKYTTIAKLRGTDPNRLNVLERRYWKDKPLETIPDHIKKLMPRAHKPIRRSSYLDLVLN